MGFCGCNGGLGEGIMGGHQLPLSQQQEGDELLEIGGYGSGQMRLSQDFSGRFAHLLGLGLGFISGTHLLHDVQRLIDVLVGQRLLLENPV